MSPPSARPYNTPEPVREPPWIDPTLPVARSSAVAASEHLRHQLTGLAEGQHTLHPLIHITRERVAWDGLTPQDIDALDSWLISRVGVAKGESRLRRGFVRGVFDTVRVELGT
jgi:hypothetical protein